MDNQRTPRNYSTGAVKRDTRQQQQKLIVILICAVIALLLLVFMTIIGTKIVVAVLGGFDNAKPGDVVYQEVTIPNTQTQYGPLALVNSTHEYKFPADATGNLVKIWDYRTAHTPEGANTAYKTNMDKLVDGAAMAAVHQWLTDFYNETGKGDAIISSAYRTFEEQSAFSVPAGQSDHHTGYGVTLKIYDGATTFEFDSDPTYKDWLTENAYKYGLVVRYPEGKEDITGISDYTNYFHYVGYGPAMYMKQNNICLEEFVALIKNYSVDQPLKVTDANDKDWLIYYAACSGDIATVKLPTNFPYTISGDNEGGLIVCVSLSKSAAQQQQQETTNNAEQ